MNLPCLAPINHHNDHLIYRTINACECNKLNTKKIKSQCSKEQKKAARDEAQNEQIAGKFKQMIWEILLISL